MRLVYSSLFDSVLVRCGFDYLFQFVHLCEALRMNDFRVERTQHLKPQKRTETQQQKTDPYHAHTNDVHLPIIF